MKTYIVYVNGIEMPDLIKAGSHNSAEKKAQKRYVDGFDIEAKDISVTYTEV
jgi:hypothetical protein